MSWRSRRRSRSGARGLRRQAVEFRSDRKSSDHASPSELAFDGTVAAARHPGRDSRLYLVPFRMAVRHRRDHRHHPRRLPDARLLRRSLQVDFSACRVSRRSSPSSATRSTTPSSSTTAFARIMRKYKKMPMLGSARPVDERDADPDDADLLHHASWRCLLAVSSSVARSFALVHLAAMICSASSSAPIRRSTSPRRCSSSSSCRPRFRRVRRQGGQGAGGNGLRSRWRSVRRGVLAPISPKGVVIRAAHYPRPRAHREPTAMAASASPPCRIAARCWCLPGGIYGWDAVSAPDALGRGKLFEKVFERIQTPSRCCWSAPAPETRAVARRAAAGNAAVKPASSPTPMSTGAAVRTLQRAAGREHGRSRRR